MRINDIISCTENARSIIIHLSLFIQVLCFNAQNATVERGFSTVNRLKTKSRNRLHAHTLEKLLRLRLSTESYDKFDYSKALECYLEGTVYSVGKAAKKARRCNVGKKYDTLLIL